MSLFRFISIFCFDFDIDIFSGNAVVLNQWAKPTLESLRTSRGPI